MDSPDGHHGAISLLRRKVGLHGGSSLISLMFLIGLVMNVLQRNLHDIWQEECSQSHVIPIAHGTNYNPPKNLSNGGDKDE